MTAHRAKKKQERRKPRAAAGFPWWIILAGIAALAAGLILALTNAGREAEFIPQVNGAPALAVDQELVDYGDVRLGTPVTTVFQVTNLGSQDLRFSKKPYVEIREGC